MYNESADSPTDESLSPTLDAADDDSSAHNQSSMIILFQPHENKNTYLWEMQDEMRLTIFRCHINF